MPGRDGGRKKRTHNALTQAKHAVGSLIELGQERVSFHCIHDGRPETFLYRLDEVLGRRRIPYFGEFSTTRDGHQLLVVSSATGQGEVLKTSIESVGGAPWPI